MAPKVVGSAASVRTVCHIVLILTTLLTCCSLAALDLDPQHVGSYLSGDLPAVALFGKYGFVPLGLSGLEVTDLSKPAEPRRAGACPTAGSGADVAVFGSYAYVALRPPLGTNLVGGGLQIVDISNPTNPQPAGLYESRWPVWSVAVSTNGNYAYLAGQALGFQVIDITDPMNPELLGQADIYGTFVAASGSHAFVVHSSGGLRIIDVSNPTQPRLVGNYITPMPPCPGLCISWPVVFAHTVAVAGNYAYLAEAVMLCGHGCVPMGGNLQVIDITTPSSPRRVGGYSYFSQQDVQAVTVSGNYAYVADGGLHVIDISDPANPRRAGAGQPRDRRHARDVAVSGSYAYFVGGGGLQIMEISRPANPQRIGSYTTVDVANDVAISGSHALVAAKQRWVWTNYIGETGLELIDTSDLANPRRVGSYDTNGANWPGGLAVFGNYVFVASGPLGLEVIDISDPVQPARVGGYRMSDAIDVTVADHYAYVVNPNTGLHVLDIVDPLNPRQVGSYSISNNAALRVAVSGNYAYVTEQPTWPENFGGFEVIDISNPTNPQRAGAYFTGRAGLGIALIAWLAYLGDETGLHVIDITNPANPQRLGGYETSGRVVDIAILGTYAYLAKDAAYHVGGLEIIDISDLNNLRRVGGNSSFPASAVTIANGKVFVAAAEQGMVILHPYQPIRFEQIARGEPGTINLRLSGPPGVPARIQSSADLLGWTDWLPVNFGESPIELTDSGANSTSGFYRVAVP